MDKIRICDICWMEGKTVIAPFGLKQTIKEDGASWKVEVDFCPDHKEEGRKLLLSLFPNGKYDMDALLKFDRKTTIAYNEYLSKMTGKKPKY